MPQGVSNASYILIAMGPKDPLDSNVNMSLTAAPLIRPIEATAPTLPVFPSMIIASNRVSPLLIPILTKRKAMKSTVAITGTKN